MMAVLISVLVIVADQISKYIIATNPALHSIVVIPGFFHITYVENTGMAWSLLSGQQGLLSLIAAVAIGVMIWYLLTRKPDKLSVIGISLMIGGAVGNLIDRLVSGYVRDFLDFYIGGYQGYDFPVFNIADSALTIGVVILFIAMLIEEKKAKKEKQSES